MESTNPELLLGDARSISGGLWRVVWLVQEAAEALDSRIEDEAWTAWWKPWRSGRH